jgi:uncharacterized DUF497 family protein
MQYEWDDTKAQANLAKHGVAFDAVAAFDWKTALIQEDRRRDYGEPRYIAIGYIGDRLYILVYTPRGASTRLIGLRKANPREIRRYAKAHARLH